jgi:hypothetical protein
MVKLGLDGGSFLGAGAVDLLRSWVDGAKSHNLGEKYVRSQ